jgi:hypothetical protein
LAIAMIPFDVFIQLSQFAACPRPHTRATASDRGELTRAVSIGHACGDVQQLHVSPAAQPIRQMCKKDVQENCDEARETSLSVLNPYP